MSAVVQPALTTAEEFVRLPEKGHPRELVRGNIVEDVMPGARHGKIGVKIARLLGNFVEEKDLGHVMSNDTFVRTHRNPDSVRGSDICYFSYDRLPRGPVPEGIVDVAPELVFEVRSPSDRWVKVISKTAEYLEAGVSVVCIVDPKDQTVSIYRPDENVRTLTVAEELSLSDILPGFRVPVQKLFK